MAGLKPPEMNRFYAKIHERGLDTAKLAEQVGRSRSIVTRVLNGSKRRGATWKRLCALLTPDEIALLDVAHRSPWNIRRVAARPKWTQEKAQAVTLAREEAA